MTKKSVGIITLQGDNYGATLQAVALNQKLNQLGFLAENLDYNDKKRVWRTLSFVRKLKYLIWRKMICGLIGREKKKKFQEFRVKYLKRSERAWRKKEDLLKNPPKYDVYISGSDQIWNADVINDDYNYLLAFVNDNEKKIAYASSFGNAFLKKEKQQIYKTYLNRYDYIAVREESAKVLVEELIERTCEVVLDPTLLLTKEEWKEFAVKDKEVEPYILCYYMPGDELVCAAIKEIAKELSEKTGKKIINLGLKEYYKLKKGMDVRTNAGPAEFIALFMNADYVVTNSFHGVAFATNFNKNLYVPINMDLDQRKSRHTRLVDYLNMLDLNEVIVNIRQGKKFELSESTINYEKANQIIDKKRKSSLEYLLKAINV